jgi:hypothetical protein
VRDHGEVARVALGKVPGVRGELVLDPLDEPGRTEEAHRGAAAKAHAQQSVQAGEVVHVRVRHKHVRHAQDPLRREPPDVADVEQHGALLVPPVEIEGGIAEHAVHQLRGDDRAH